jgi:hypothetical protein
MEQKEADADLTVSVQHKVSLKKVRFKNLIPNVESTPTVSSLLTLVVSINEREN